MGGAILEKQRSDDYLDDVQDKPFCTGTMMLDFICIEDKYSTPVQLLFILFAMTVLAAVLLAKHIYGPQDKIQADPLTSLLLEQPLVQEALVSLGVCLPESGPSKSQPMQNVTAEPAPEEPVIHFVDQEAESELMPVADPLVDDALGCSQDLLCSSDQDILVPEQDNNVLQEFAS